MQEMRYICPKIVHVMKKNVLMLVLGIVLAVAAESCAPLRIVFNSADKAGTRRMLTSDVNLFDSFSMAMGAKISKADTLLSVLVTSSKKSDHGIFDLNDRLMIRLGDGTEFAITNVYDKKYKKEEETRVSEDVDYRPGFAYCYSPWTDAVYVTPYMARRMIPRVYNYTVTKSYAMYFISKKQINDIMSKGIVKLRIEIEDADCDMPNPEDATAKFTEVYTFLHEAAKAGVKRSEF